MLAFNYGPVFTTAVGTELELGTVSQLLTPDPEQPSLLLGSYLPTGLLSHVCTRLDMIDVPYVLHNTPAEGSIYDVPPDYLAGITLREEQRMLIRKGLYHQRGLIESPTGSGKTELTCAIAQWLDGRVLVLVPGTNSLHQTAARFKKRGLDDVGMFGDGKRDLNHRVIVAIVASVYQAIGRRKADVLRILSELQAVLLLECHHLQAMTWQTVCQNTEAPYRLGLSATLFEKGSQPTTHGDYALIGQTGPVVAKLPDHLLMNRGHLATPWVHTLRVFQPERTDEQKKCDNWIQQQRECIVHNKPRNTMIVQVAAPLVREGFKILTLVNVLKHGDTLGKMASEAVRPLEVQFYHGGSTLDVYRDGIRVRREKLPIYKLVDKLEAEPEFFLIGSPAVKEDADFPGANVLVAAGAGRGYRGVIQRTGRVLRAKQGTNIGHLVDFKDYTAWMLKAQSDARRKTYEARYAGAERLRFLDHRTPADVVEAIRHAA